MELLKFILWLTAGAVIGWFASRIVSTENGWAKKAELVEECDSDEYLYGLPCMVSSWFDRRIFGGPGDERWRLWINWRHHRRYHRRPVGRLDWNHVAAHQCWRERDQPGVNPGSLRRSGAADPGYPLIRWEKKLPEITGGKSSSARLSPNKPLFYI
jgi:hypothetical protein